MESAPELATLRGDARRIWNDADERARRIEAVVDGLDGDEAQLRASIERLDRAVAAGLRAFGFPRGRIRGIAIEPGMVMWAGRKDMHCTIHLNAMALRSAAQLGMLDGIFRTWVHESLHARQPFADDYRREYAYFPGYEEGLVESLARDLLARADVRAISESFDYYVAGYRSLAAALGLQPRLLWQALWRVRPGEVRAAFPAVLYALYEQVTDSRLSAARLSKLRGLADTVFVDGREDRLPDQRELTRLWQVALR